MLSLQAVQDLIIGNHTESLQLFNVQPNPNSGIFDVDIAGQVHKHLQLTVFNTLGKVVFNEYYDFNTGQLKRRVHLENLASGIYFIRAGTTSQAEYRKMIFR